MQFIKKLFSTENAGNSLKLQFDKLDQNWKVKIDGSVVYLGTKEQCQTYINHQRGI